MRRSVEMLVAAVVLFVSVSPVMAVIEFNDGGVWDIDYEIHDDVWIDYLKPGMQTTVNLLAGGSIITFPPYEYYMLQAFEDSLINISGGSMDTVLRAYDSSQVNISGGSLKGGCQAYGNRAFGNNRINISGGSIGGLLEAFGNSQMSISGGSINWLEAYSDSRVSISGGSLSVLGALSRSKVTVSGGSIINELFADYEGILTIHGSDFAVDGTPVGYTELTSILGGSCYNEPYRHLTGTLFSGESIANDFGIGKNGKIVLIPEPATLLLLGLGAVMVRRKRS